MNYIANPAVAALAAAVLLLLLLLALSSGKVLIWRAYRLHGAALKDMKSKLKDWESLLSNSRRVDTAGVGMA